MRGVDGREHGAATVRPSDQTQAARIDVRARGQPCERRECVAAALPLGDPACADALRAQLALSARTERIDDQRMPAGASGEIDDIGQATVQPLSA